MGRINKETGEFKPKPSVQKKSDWYQQEPQPMRSMRKKTAVKVYSGGGWVKATVVQWSLTGITCYLSRQKQTVTVRDNRNIIEDSSK